MTRGETFMELLDQYLIRREDLSEASCLEECECQSCPRVRYALIGTELADYITSFFTVENLRG